jgi:hypothetical protein
MSQSLNSIPTFDGTNYGYWKSRMRFFLKSINVWQIVETGWTKLVLQLLNYLLFKTAHDFPMIKPYMLYVKCFHRLISQEFQTVNLLKKHGKS